MLLPLPNLWLLTSLRKFRFSLFSLRRVFFGKNRFCSLVLQNATQRTSTMSEAVVSISSSLSMIPMLEALKNKWNNRRPTIRSRATLQVRLLCQIFARWLMSSFLSFSLPISPQPSSSSSNYGARTQSTSEEAMDSARREYLAKDRPAGTSQKKYEKYWKKDCNQATLYL